MEVGKYYIFYDGDIPHVGRLTGSIDFTEVIYVFAMMDGSYKFSNTVHDALNEKMTTQLFLNHLRIAIENEIPFDLVKEISHNDYEFKVVIARPDRDIFSLDNIESAMNNVLEDFWSAQWEELQENNISIHGIDVIIAFRVHNIHEAEMRFNDKRL